MATHVFIRPDDPRTTAFRWIAGYLRGHPLLAHHVDDWQAWEGQPTEDDAFPEGRVTVRLTPSFEPETPESNQSFPGKQQFRAPVLVEVMVGIPGSHADNAMNLCGLIHDAILAPFSRADRLESRISWIESVTPPMRVGDNAIASGSVRLVMCLTR